MSSSSHLKEEGNKCFRSGNYEGAESFYSQAIVADPKNHALYTNRAMARLKLGRWDSVIADCQTCAALCPTSMKAFFYLGQAQLELRHYDDAVASYLRAHALCVANDETKSLPSVTQGVLRCKKERWEFREQQRKREHRDLERRTVALLEKERDEELMAVEDESVRNDIREEYEASLKNLTEIFDKARAESDRRREVPDWFIDEISFGVMVDPVVTLSGKSYERASIMEHLRRKATDPLTNAPMSTRDLRPNLPLKAACADFLEHNGWAVDW
ncbi:hypothetical protein S40285_03161 [Stachybotrys chlorohalonatus IBT 40285]|uniref:U-box domain-containing protein n=1 Tax=Stachybotrys chlorohalonatus (strain IBT 40285) TaxID=1283841 RepID=A0A084QI62_STAC4|nr:hypothetical protein S40285_03161 [Stachybotrys chlorohalonata IBT 40285]